MKSKTFKKVIRETCTDVIKYSEAYNFEVASDRLAQLSNCIVDFANEASLLQVPLILWATCKQSQVSRYMGKLLELKMIKERRGN